MAAITRYVVKDSMGNEQEVATSVEAVRLTKKMAEVLPKGHKVVIFCAFRDEQWEQCAELGGVR